MTWKFEGMVELIRGKVFQMSPAPNRAHQKVSRNLLLKIGNYLEGNKCEVYNAPFDVRLPLPENQKTNNKIETVVQPDLCVICDPRKLDVQGCIGAPDWVIEILSKSTSKKDFTDKFEVYENAGVREYWIVDPESCILTTYLLNEEGKYKQASNRPYVRGESVPVAVFSGFSIEINEIFRD